MKFKVTGPRGHLVGRGTATAVAKALPKLLAKFKAVAIKTATAAKQKAPAVTTRQKIVKWARWGVANEPQIHYSEGPGRDGWLHQPVGVLPLTTDCSGFATYCYRAAGALDPNGLGYRSLGYTGTLLDHGTVVSSCKAGDLVVYGPGTGHHVVIAVEAGTDPMCVSHGQEKGPLYVRCSDEARYQPAPVRRLRFLP